MDDGIYSDGESWELKEPILFEEDSGYQASGNNGEDHYLLSPSKADKTNESMIQKMYGPTASPCCKTLKCNEKIPEDVVIEHRISIQELSKPEQDLIVLAYLQGHRFESRLKTVYDQQKGRQEDGDVDCNNSGRPKTCYFFRGLEICRTFFLFIHDLGKDKNLIKHFDQNGVTPRVHGLKNVRPVGIPVLSTDDKDRARKFIENFGNQHGLPLPGRTPQFKNHDVIKLPPGICISKVLR